MRTYSFETALKRLNDAGIPAKMYARPPAGKYLFTIGIADRYKKTERINFYPGLVETMALSIDRKLKQAVVQVYERSQTATFVAKTHPWWKTHTYNAGISRANLIRQFRGYSKIGWPEGTQCAWVTPVDQGASPGTARSLFTVRTPEATRTFLIGYDTDLIRDCVFISMLPKPVSTVKEAHDLLRPSGVPKGSPRQGDFYFVPDPTYNSARVNKGPDRNSNIYTSIPYPSWYVWDGHPSLSDHVAEYSIVNYKAKIQRVRGNVTNPRHETLYLDGWHRVVGVNEVDLPVQQQRWD